MMHCAIKPGKTSQLATLSNTTSQKLKLCVLGNTDNTQPETSSSSPAAMYQFRKVGHSAIFAIVVSALLQACVYVPRTTEVYDANCRIISRHMELQPVQIVAIHGCGGDGCVAILAAATATAATSAVISGSIVVVGNVVYWFEKQGQCKRGY